jgi:hypothetical protein
VTATDGRADPALITVRMARAASVRSSRTRRPSTEDGTVAERTPDEDREPPRGGAGHGGLVDAERFLRLTERLQHVRERVEDGDDDRRRNHWQRLLVAISDAAKDVLEVAERKLTRLEAELDRHLGDA